MAKLNKHLNLTDIFYPPLKFGFIMLLFVFPSFLLFFKFRIGAFRRFDPSRIPLLALQVFHISPAIDRQFWTPFPCTFFLPVCYNEGGLRNQGISSSSKPRRIFRIFPSFLSIALELVFEKGNGVYWIYTIHGV